MLYIRNENRFSRSSGSAVKANSPAYVIYEGTALVEVKNAVTGAIEVKPYEVADLTAGTGGAALSCAGLALESNQMPPIGPQDGAPFTVGDGFDFTRYNRGGLIATIQDALVTLDTQNGLITVDDTYVMDGAIYWNPTDAVFTVTAAGAIKVGTVKNWTGTNGSDVQTLTIKLDVLV